jgi:hypothetical protein
MFADLKRLSPRRQRTVSPDQSRKGHKDEDLLGEWSIRVDRMQYLAYLRDECWHSRVFTITRTRRIDVERSAHGPGLRFHHDHVVAQVLRFVDVVRDHQDSDVALMREPQQQVLHLHARERVDGGKMARRAAAASGR